MKHFHLGAASGVIATAAAGEALFAFHNASSFAMHIQRIRARCSVVAPPTDTDHQEFALKLALAEFGDDYTDGLNLSDPATAANYAVRNRNLDKARVLQNSWRPPSALASGNVRIADTADLTAGSSAPTIDAHGFAWAGDYIVGAGTVATRPVIDLLWLNPTAGKEHERPDIGCIPLESDRGFVILAPVALANSMTIRLAVEVDWIET